MTASSGPSRVLAVPAAGPRAAHDYFHGIRLACETDPYDVYHDMSAGVSGIVLADARKEPDHREETLPGALSLPHDALTAAVCAGLDPEPLYVTFGWGPGCNAGTSAAAALAAAGLRVKEMIGGLEYWKRQNHPTTRTGDEGMSAGIKNVIDEVNEIRATLEKKADPRSPEFLADLLDKLERSEHVRHEPAARALIADLRDYQDDHRLLRTKEHINTRRDQNLFSLFDASYFPRLSLDFLSYSTLPTNPHLAERYASNTMPVNITACSEGFRSRVVVALFPENHLDGRQDPDDLIFYFVDKFVERHNRITRTMIDEVMAPGSFPLIQGADDDTIEGASSWWVRLHEFHHRQGDMPIPDFLHAKKLKPLAGLEELRVDVSSMLVCLNDGELPADEARAAYEYILAERLLRYAVEGIPRPNYDAVASQLLFNYLSRHGGITLSDGRISLRPELPGVLTQFLGEIQAVERRIHDEPVADVRAGLLAFTNGYTDYDDEAGDYRHIPFFAEVKKRLGV
ncbi:hypothetical protein N566_20845 [Streptomycetaceae bacterium MP113-05]|nr:hypothetical protein N566_20845 [Streptomycetaceae bacterium MP113-05]